MHYLYFHSFCRRFLIHFETRSPKLSHPEHPLWFSKQTSSSTSSPSSSADQKGKLRSCSVQPRFNFPDNLTFFFFLTPWCLFQLSTDLSWENELVGLVNISRDESIRNWIAPFPPAPSIQANLTSLLLTKSPSVCVSYYSENIQPDHIPNKWILVQTLRGILSQLCRLFLPEVAWTILSAKYEFTKKSKPTQVYRSACHACPSWRRRSGLHNPNNCRRPRRPTPTPPAPPPRTIYYFSSGELARKVTPPDFNFTQSYFSPRPVLWSRALVVGLSPAFLTHNDSTIKSLLSNTQYI